MPSPAWCRRKSCQRSTSSPACSTATSFAPSPETSPPRPTPPASPGAVTTAAPLSSSRSHSLAPLAPYKQHARRRDDQADEARERSLGLELNRQDADQAL